MTEGLEFTITHTHTQKKNKERKEQLKQVWQNLIIIESE